MIFLSITGSWTAAVLYDRREKKRIQRKWATLVEHIASEPLDTQQLPRKLSVYLAAPPADGLVPARDHFNEYVKPILVSAALDWDAIEGRREGDVRAGLAERIRKLRKKRGERSEEPIEEDAQEILEETRTRAGTRDWDGTPGDIVIGRHTWKEYVRGLHEGWLGPLDAPTPTDNNITMPTTETLTTQEASIPASTSLADDASPNTAPEAGKSKEEEKPKADEDKPKKRKQPPPFNNTYDYNNSLLSPNCPQALGPTAVIPLPHLLGFLNFPIRMYRFLNRRKVADEAGRQTAAAVLAAYQPYNGPGEANPVSTSEEDTPMWEQQGLLQHEEAEWHKSVRERKDDSDKEREWLDDMVLDPRIAERMRKFVLDFESEERGKRRASEPRDAWWKIMWPKKEEKRNLWEGLEED